MEPFREFIGSLSRMQAILMALESSSFKLMDEERREKKSNSTLHHVTMTLSTLHFDIKKNEMSQQAIGARWFPLSGAAISLARSTKDR